LTLRLTAWLLNLPISLLSDWNRGFDEQMRPLKIPDGRGKDSKIAPDVVRDIVREANRLKEFGKQIKLKGFTKQLKSEHAIFLSRKKVREILIANDLFEARVRKRRPKFYQSIRKEIPNGLVSIDGSELTVLVGHMPHKFNVELCVDVSSFAHTAFSVGDSESSDEIIKVVTTHSKNWGIPLGILCDHGSSNLSEKTRAYLEHHDIQLVPVGPSNPKGNGTDEGAFSHMKRTLGTIQLDTSSPRALARTVLEKIIDIYVSMRNRIPSKQSTLPPREAINRAVSQRERDAEKQRLKDHNRRRMDSQEDQKKKDRLDYIVSHHGICLDPEEYKRAERSIKAFELKAMESAEQAFLKAVARNPQKATFPYFFGILKNIQQERDDGAYKEYCYERYNQEVMLKLKQDHGQTKDPEHCVENVIGLLIPAMEAKISIVKELAIKKARQWTQELMQLHCYPGVLKKRFADAMGAFTDLPLDLKNKIWELIEQFLEAKPLTESVTHFS
jgi:hypothetical protein